MIVRNVMLGWEKDLGQFNFYYWEIEQPHFKDAII